MHPFVCFLDFKIYMLLGVLLEGMFVHHVCPTSTEARRGRSVPWNYRYKWLLVALRVLRIEPGSPGRAANALIH